MKRLRITVERNVQDPADDLRYAARIRRDLWAHSPAELDPNDESCRTRRDKDRNAYFEFSTEYFDQVREALERLGHTRRASVAVIDESAGHSCVYCGFTMAPVLPTVCPDCGRRDIAACPHCGREVPRLKYTPQVGDLFRCPECTGLVRFRLHDPTFDAPEAIDRPLIDVESAEPAR
jgi:DNA-directed RNA polymerase subunit RPC12/RpoP